MGDGSDSAALTVLPKNCSQSSENHSNGQGKICSACREPTKGHFGPYGAAKCVAVALKRLTTSVDDLERDRDQKDETIRKTEQVHTKRTDGLLATIEDLQSEVERLVEQLAKERASCPCKCKARGDDDAGCACVTPALAFGKSCQRESLPIMVWKLLEEP